MKKLLLVISFFALSACASSIMDGFVGQPVQQAMVKYGPPQNAFDMGDGRRAFQWVMSGSYTTPTNVNNSGMVSPIGNQVWWQQNTTITGGQTINSECIYTMYGRWSESANAWILETYEKPRFLCE